LLTSINTQLTPDSLLSLERFSIGGVDTVRGYRQNQLVSDNGVLGAVELRIPLTENPKNLQVNPFVEKRYRCCFPKIGRYCNALFAPKKQDCILVSCWSNMS
ncbi:MAG: ShlB/FhaC/HecB family hemolysin secretion/activation protein, partial [Rivularia sp. (in: cyanobacteria)]